MKITGRTLPAIFIAVASTLVCLFFVNAAFASELNLTKFTVSPSPFKKGDAIRITVVVENPNDTAAKPGYNGEVFAYVDDGTPERQGPGAFLGKTKLPATIGPKETVTVTLAQTYTPPKNAGDQITFTLLLPPIGRGVEFGPSFQYRFHATVIYSPELKIKKMPPMKPLHLGK